MKNMKNLWQTITGWFSVSADLKEDMDAYYRARLTMIVGAVVLFFYFLPELAGVLFYHTGPFDKKEFWLIVGAGGAILLAIFIARRYYSLASWVMLIAWTVDVQIDTVLGGMSEEFPGQLLEVEIWLLFGLVMAFVLLDLYEYMVFAFLQGASTIIVLLTGLGVQSLPFNVRLHFISVLLLGIGVWLRMREQRDRQAAERSLRQQSDYLQRVIDGIQSPFYVVNVSDYRIELANHAARELGFMEEQTTCYALTHNRTQPCGGDEHPCPLQHVTQQREPFTTEHIHFRPNGDPYYAEVRGYPLFDEEGNVVQMVEYSVDITARKQAEAQIRQLQKAVEHAATGVVVTDADGVFLYVNPVFERITGYSREETLGKTPNILKSGHHSPEFYRELWDTIESGQVWQGEMLNKRKDGSLYWEYQTIAPVMSNGAITHYVAVKQDITERKEMEEALRVAKEEAEKANAFKSRLLANISHDMRTPLGGIIGFAEMLKEGMFGEIAEAQAEPLDAIIHSAEQLAGFIEGMLLRAELESGKLRLNVRPFAPADLLQAVASHARLAQEKGLAFQADVDPNLPPEIMGDPYWLEHILINLVDNAIKYTEKGRVSVRLLRQEGERWAIEVADTGMGIPDDLHDFIFQAFEQVESGPGKQIEGVGLGLSIVQQLADALGGEIRLESRLGEGSKFTVSFPLQRPPEEAA